MTTLRFLLLGATLGLAAACGRTPQPAAQAAAPAPAAPASAPAPAPAPVPALTEAQVREVATAAEAAVARFDSRMLSVSLSDDVRLDAIPPPSYGPTLKIQGRDRVLDQIDSAWGNVQAPAYSSSIGAVAMAADGNSGYVQFAAVTRYRMDRHDVVEESTDTYTVMTRAGVPKVVAMHQATTGLTIDGDKRF